MEEIRDIEWVMRRKNRHHGLAPIRAALKDAGDPHLKLRTVHIAGTNGKGSTVSYLRALLESEGYRTGTFTSPHLVSHCDRIRINNEWISEETFLSYLAKDMEMIEKYDLGMFEIDTLIALQWFADEKADIILMETGLGGRLDNTNIFDNPELCIITTIAYDHMEILGSRIQQIAFEKAGIIMPYGRCITGHLDPHAMNVIRRNAWRRHARVIEAGKIRDTGGNSFVLRGVRYTVQGARYQKQNAALALEAARLLGVDAGSDKAVRAIAGTVWPGRFETVRHDPEVILDGAHNEEGIRALCESLPAVKEPLTVVFSALGDKPGRKMASMLKRRCQRLILTHFDNARSEKKPLEMKGAESIADWQAAAEEALKQKEGTVVFTGSLYFISLVRAYLHATSDDV